MGKRFSKTFWCFSPPVMLATFFIETFGAVYVFLRYKNTQITRIIIALLFCLGIFQLAEYFICEGGIALPGLVWARIGYVAITLLPPLGISLAMAIARKRSRTGQVALYVIATGFIMYFLFVKNALVAEICAGNYVIFESNHSHIHYGLYYYSLLMVGVWMCFNWAREAKEKNVRSALTWLGGGYLAFMLPTALVNIVEPATLAAIPSIMCGFAVVLALVLIFKVAPKVCEKREWGKLSKKEIG
ncbi:hypothetical protein FWH09_02450 [Candidatus Saccharibacteria bacterium]|nr:hypothetical protein [Candidatus Saccharibacteria bacterium]